MSELDRLLAEARRLEPEPIDEETLDRTVARAALAGRARHRAWVRRRAILAMALGAAAAAAALHFALQPSTPSAPTAPARVATHEPAAATTPRERTDLALPTGDRLLAEEGARFHVEMATDRERRIRLSHGSMLFDVQPLEGGRFTVRTPTAEVVVLGTVFTVTTGPEGTVVRVYEGRVEVRHHDRVDHVTAGEHATVEADRAPDRDAESPVAAPDPLATEARRAARSRHPVTLSPVPAPASTATARPRRPAAPLPAPEPAIGDVRSWIAEGQAPRALAEARRHVDRGELDPWLLLEADALRALGRNDEAADAYGRASERLPSPRAEQAGFASARLRRAPELALRALDTGRVTEPGSPLRERGLALRVDLLGRLGREGERRRAAEAYLDAYPGGSRAPSMQGLLTTSDP